MTKIIACPKCGDNWIGESKFLFTGFSYFKCYNCLYVSDKKKEFIKDV